MMCNAQLFTKVIKPDFTEHTVEEVLSVHNKPKWSQELILLKEISHFFLIINHFTSRL